jgi:hypothetical protein
MVPYNEVSDTPIRATKKSVKPKNPNRTVTEQSKFRQDVEGESEKGELPLSSTSIQPDDQRYINSVTGVNTEIPKESRATDAHHIFGVESNPKLKNNPNNGIMLTRKEHREVETLNKGLLRKQAMLRLASIRSRIAGLDKFYNNIMKESARIRQDKYDPITQTYTEPAIPGTDERYSVSDKHCGGTSCAINKMFPKSKLTKVRGNVKYKGIYEEHAWNTNEKGDIIDASRDQFGDSKDVHVIKPNDKRYHSYTESQPHLMKNKKLMKQHMKRQQRRSDSNVNKYNEEKLGTEGHEIKISKLKQKIATFKQDIRHKNDMAANVLNLSADAIMNKFIEFKKNNDDFKSLTGTFDPLQGAIIDARVPAGAMRLQNIFGVKGKLAFNSITDTRQGPVTDLDLIRSQLKEIEQSGEVPSIGVFEGSIEATIALIDKTDDEILENLLESQRSTAIIDPDTRLRIVDNVSFRQN